MAERPRGPIPQEAVDFFDDKVLRPSWSWEDVWAEEHARAFTVAKALETSVLELLQTEVRRALHEGRTIQDFRRELEPRLIEAGWWGRKEVVDQRTGEVLEGQLGSPSRLKLIFDANMRSARSVGVWERAQATKDLRPYFIYELGPSRNHRPEHLALKGLILPVDDPFWDKWLPPNGWGCKCRVRQITEAEARRLGGVGVAPVIPMVNYRRRTDGAIIQVPQGIDPGWAHNPGKARHLQAA